MKTIIRILLITSLIAGLFAIDLSLKRPKEPPTVITVAGILQGSKPGYTRSGEYNVNTNTITIDTMHARRQGLTYEQVLTHEMTHYRQHRDHPVISRIIEILYRNDYENNPLEKEARNVTK